MWFQNRRMKHKRQTLGKQSEDGSDKDSQSTKSTKSEKSKSLICDDSKKSCQSCDLPSSMINDHLAGRNSGSFNTNSNGSTGISSADSNSSSFEKMEEDSRSNEGSGTLTSPSMKKHEEVVIKIENNSVCCSPPKNQKKSTGLNKDPNQLVTSDIKNCPVLAAPVVGLTPSTPNTPSSVPRVSPLSTSPWDSSSKARSPMHMSTNTSNNFANQSPPIIVQTSSSLLQVSRNSTPTTYPSPPQHKPPPPPPPPVPPDCPFKGGNLYRTCSPRETAYHQQQIHAAYSNHAPPTHHQSSALVHGRGYPLAEASSYRQTAPRVNGMHTTANSPKLVNATVPRQSYPCHQYAQQYCGNYNGSTANSQSDLPPYQSYQRTNYHPQNYAEDYIPGSVNYGSYQTSYGHNEHVSTNPFYATNHNYNHHPQHHHQSDYANPNTTKAAVPFFDDTTASNGSSSHNSNHRHNNHGDVSAYSVPPPPDPYTTVPPPPLPPPTSNSSIVMSPPNGARVSTDSGDQLNTFSHFYANNSSNAQLQQNPSMFLPADSSNSSSEFNFLSNIANDFAPEYYQLS